MGDPFQEGVRCRPRAPQTQEMIRDEVPGFRDPTTIPALPPRPRWLPSTPLTSGSRPRATGSSPPVGAPNTATVIDNRGGEAVFTDGPFLESKEHMAGFWIIEAPDLDVALKLAAEGSKHCNRKVEVRPFLADPA